MSTEGIDEWVGEVHTGDSLDVLDDMPAESVHSVVTDPPYGLNFMGKDWDNFRRRNNEDDAGRDDVFGRTSSTSPAHGAETEGRRYQVWCQEWASKVKRVLKPGGHLLAFSGNRTHHRLFTGVEDAGFEIRDTLTWHYGSGFPKALDVGKQDVDGWDGWKTGLKPATEFVALARKPLSEGTVAENVLEHGTGALNIDGTRIDADGDGWTREGTRQDIRGGNYGSADARGERIGDEDDVQEMPEGGRYPANVAFDERAASDLDDEVGELSSGSRDAGTYNGAGDVAYGEFDDADLPGLEGSTGGPSRYFYTSKATRSERTEGGWIENDHPTVKPTDLMDWLVRLVTRRDQIVLDPFAGTGTTCKAAKEAHRQFVGIEKDPKWADVARARIGIDVVDPSNVTDTDEHVPISEF